MRTTGQAGQRNLALARAVGWFFPAAGMARVVFNGAKAVGGAIARAPGKAAATAMLAALPYVAKPADGAMIEQTLVNDTTVRETWVNDDNGAEFNSWEARALTDLVSKVYDLPGNSSRFSSPSDVFASASVGTAPASEVDFGWNLVHDNGLVKYVNNDGLPGFGYEVWFADQQNANQNEASKYLNLANALDLDNDGQNDYLIVKTTEEMADAGVGVIGNTPQVQANGYRWDVQEVPEPTTAALLALGGLGVLVRRRRRVGTDTESVRKDVQKLHGPQVDEMLKRYAA